MTTLRLKTTLPPAKMAALFPGQKPPEPPKSEETNNGSKRYNDLHTMKADVKALQKAFPVIAENKPLAVGIFEELAAAHPQRSKNRLRRAIKRHTRSPDYLRAVAEPGAMRYSLTGEPVAPVSDDHREWAGSVLAEREARQ